MTARTYSTGLTPATPAHLRDLADATERWERRDITQSRELESRICAAMMQHNGWEYVPPRPYEPPVKEGRKIVTRAKEAIGPRIRRSYTERDDTGRTTMVGGEESRAPEVLTDIKQAFGFLHKRVLITLSEIGADGLPLAHVGGGEGMRAEGKGIGGATMAATLVAAVLRCEAMEREQAA
jgi:hypothetical protein